MPDGDFIDGHIEAMNSYVPHGPYLVAPTVSLECVMPEGKDFAAAERVATDRLVAFVTGARQGIKWLTNTAKAEASNYANADKASEDLIKNCLANASTVSERLNKFPSGFSYER